MPAIRIRLWIDSIQPSAGCMRLEGRPSFLPKQLLLALLLQAFCGIRSERLLLE